MFLLESLWSIEEANDVVEPTARVGKGIELIVVEDFEREERDREKKTGGGKIGRSRTSAAVFCVARTRRGEKDLVFFRDDEGGKETIGGGGGGGGGKHTGSSSSCVLKITRRGGREAFANEIEAFDVRGLRVVSNARHVEVYVELGEDDKSVTYVTTLRGEPVSDIDRTSNAVASTTRGVIESIGNVRRDPSEEESRERTGEGSAAARTRPGSGGSSTSSSSSSSSGRLSAKSSPPMFSAVWSKISPRFRRVRSVRLKMLSIKMPKGIYPRRPRGTEDKAKKRLHLQSLQLACDWTERARSNAAVKSSRVSSETSSKAFSAANSSPIPKAPKSGTALPPSLIGLQTIVTGLAKGLENKLTLAMNQGFERVENRLDALEIRVKALEEANGS